MMAYSIDAALGIDAFERVIVSTDSPKYGKIAEDAGAEVIYRGEAASNDYASTYDVIEDLFKKIELDFDYFVLLQPTSPMRNTRHIRQATELFESRFDEFDFLVSVKEAEHNGLLVKPIGDDLSLRHFDTDFANYRRQLYKDYSPNGAIFMGKPQAYLERKHFFGQRAIAYKMTAFDSVDIDTELDFKFAEFCMQEMKKGKF